MILFRITVSKIPDTVQNRCVQNCRVLLKILFSPWGKYTLFLLDPNYSLLICTYLYFEEVFVFQHSRIFCLPSQTWGIDHVMRFFFLGLCFVVINPPAWVAWEPSWSSLFFFKPIKHPPSLSMRIPF